MQYVAAFNSLRYDVIAPRSDWTAENATGVCLTLWKQEIDWSNLRMDSRLHGGPIEDWGTKSGNEKRIRHAKRALEEFDGWVDVVLVSGRPGEGYEDATPWVPSDRKGKRWKVVALDEASGHIVVEACNSSERT